MNKGVFTGHQSFFLEQGYEVENSQITHVDLTMRDNGCLTLWLELQGGCNCSYGGYCLGHGYLGAKEFTGSAKAIEYIMILMDIVGVDRFEDLKGKYVRCVNKGIGSKISYIGNITKNKWFDQEEFFKKDE